MSDFTIRTSTTPPATIKVQLDPSQSVAEAVAAADAAAASEAAALASETAAAGSASNAATSASAASASASAAAVSASEASTDANDAAASAAAAAATLDSSLKKADNLSDLASASAARGNLGSTAVGDAVFIAANAGAAQTALGVPPNARTITAGTGLTGGGDLSSDRTISASVASQAQAQAGTATDMLMTPLATRQALNATGTAPAYACRAWVNFTGTGTVAISASGNVSSITDNGTGDYTVNFTTAMPDASYAAVATCQIASGSVSVRATDYLAGSVKILTNASGAAADAGPVSVSIFR